MNKNVLLKVNYFLTITLKQMKTKDADVLNLGETKVCEIVLNVYINIILFSFFFFFFSCCFFYLFCIYQLTAMLTIVLIMMRQIFPWYLIQAADEKWKVIQILFDDIDVFVLMVYWEYFFRKINHMSTNTALGWYCL